MIAFPIGEKLFWRNNIVKGQLDMLEKEWLYYCPAAKSAAKIQGEDGLHAFKKNHLQMFPKVHRRGYFNSNESNNINLINRSRIK